MAELPCHKHRHATRASEKASPMSIFAIIFTYYRTLPGFAWLARLSDNEQSWRGLTYLAFLFLLLGMTGHDDMVACAHNVSLPSTSVIWGQARLLAIFGSWILPTSVRSAVPDNFVVACPFLYISMHVGTRCRPIFCFLPWPVYNVAQSTPSGSHVPSSPYHDNMTNMTMSSPDDGFLFSSLRVRSLRKVQSAS